ncbi:MAG: hypothetical protein ACLGHQ_06420, partial [Acidimicrobiia bacterium]
MPDDGKALGGRGSRFDDDELAHHAAVFVEEEVAAIAPAVSASTSTIVAASRERRRDTVVGSAVDTVVACWVGQGRRADQGLDGGRLVLVERHARQDRSSQRGSHQLRS